MWQRSTRKIGKSELNSAWAFIDISCWDMHAAKSMIRFLYIYWVIITFEYLAFIAVRTYKARTQYRNYNVHA